MVSLDLHDRGTQGERRSKDRRPAGRSYLYPAGEDEIEQWWITQGRVDRPSKRSPKEWGVEPPGTWKKCSWRQRQVLSARTSTFFIQRAP